MFNIHPIPLSFEYCLSLKSWNSTDRNDALILLYQQFLDYRPTKLHQGRIGIIYAKKYILMFNICEFI